MEALKNMKVSTLVGTLAILVSSLPLIGYMQYFKMEQAKQKTGVESSPIWMNHLPVKN